MANFNQTPSDQPLNSSVALTYGHTELFNADVVNIDDYWALSQIDAPGYPLLSASIPYNSPTIGVNASNVVIKEALLYYQEEVTYPLTGQRWPNRI